MLAQFLMEPHVGSGVIFTILAVVSIGAFEHFGRDRYDEFFKKAYAALPADGGLRRSRSCWS